MFMYSVVAVYSKRSVMNIVGITSNEDTANKVKRIIVEKFRGSTIDDFVDVLKEYGPNVYLNEVPYRMHNISEEREKVFKNNLAEFMKKEDKFDIGSASTLPIQSI